MTPENPAPSAATPAATPSAAPNVVPLAPPAASVAPPPAAQKAPAAPVAPPPPAAAAAAAVPVAPPAPPARPAAIPTPPAAPARPAAAPVPPAVPPAPAPATQSFAPPAAASRLHRRHIGLAASFVALVLLPTVIAAWYLWARAADQYASTLGFSVHHEQTNSALGILAGISSISGSSSTDTDVLYEYIYSQELVAEIDAELDLRRIWSLPGETDPIFAYSPPGTIEDLQAYWEDMVTVYYNSTTRLIEIRALAFTPEDAQKITTAIFDRSTRMINRLNDIAAADAIRYTSEDMKVAEDGVLSARTAMTRFRNLHQLVDPSADLAAQSGILAGLEQQLTAALVESDLLRETVPAGDPRIANLDRRIHVIEQRITAERAKLGIGGGAEGTGGKMVDLVAEYERLAVDLQFAENAYLAARAAHEAARAEARRQSRYLAAHVKPTLSESSRYPERLHLLAVCSVFLFMLWSLGALIYYSLRDRR